jgi:DNA-binding MarR family transcriptional regulator
MQAHDANLLSSWALVAGDAMEQAVVDATGLPARSVAALVLLRNRPASNLDWLYGRLGITQSGTVRLVDRLVNLGLVRREKLPGRREVLLHVTAQGEARLQRALTARGRAMQALVEPLSAAEQKRFAASVAKLLAGSARTRGEADVACRLCNWDACKPVCPVDASVIESGVDSPAAVIESGVD